MNFQWCSSPPSTRDNSGVRTPIANSCCLCLWRCRRQRGVLVFPTRSSLVSWPDYGTTPTGTQPAKGTAVLTPWMTVTMPLNSDHTPYLQRQRGGSFIVWSLNKCVTGELEQPLSPLFPWGKGSHHVTCLAISCRLLIWESRVGQLFFFFPLKWLKLFDFCCNQNIILRHSMASLQLFYLF